MSLITTCGCGKTMTYTTRKPQKCAECKRKDKAPATKGRRYPKNMQTKGELLLFAVLNQMIISEYINHGFYSVLLSPKYQPLQIDRYYPRYRLGFEFDGRQHDEYVKYIHKNRKNFTYQKECDKIKDRECKANGITLIRIGHKDKITNKFIANKIKAANEELYIQMLKEGTLIDE
jgi:very-short-patch-repair endonuclease